MTHRDEFYIEPFEMFPDLYFVGNRRVSVHIIKTAEGLVMIDTGYPDMYDTIIENIRRVGLNETDICAIFHSHGHIDHYGCTRELVKLTGAKTYISPVDNEIVNGKYDLSFAKEEGYENIPPFDCDVLIDDGDVFTFGETKIRCVLTPGHTDGTMSFFVSLSDGGREITAAMHGGIGMGSMSGAFLDKYGLSYDCRDRFRAGINMLMKEKVHLVMGNHPYQNNTEEKCRKALAGENIEDSGEWQRLLLTALGDLERMIENETK